VASLRSLVLNGLLLAGSLGFTLGSLEIAVRQLGSRDTPGPLAVLDLDHQNRRLSFLPHRSRRYETAEFTFDASYNRFGRRDRDWPAEVVSDESSVIMLGDSFVFGVGVEAEQTVPSLLEAYAGQHGEPREVMNFGIPGGGPPSYAALLDDAFARGFGASTVVVGVFVGNDFYPSVLSELSRLPAVAAPPPETGGRPRSVLLQMLRTRVSQSARMVGLALTVGRWLGVPVYDGAGTYIYLRERAPEQEDTFQQILSYLGQMQEACDANGRRLLVVVFPNRIQVENQDDLTNFIYDAERPGRDIGAYCAAHGIPCLDLLPELTRVHGSAQDPLFFPVDRHLTVHGNQAAADAVYAFLVEQGVFGRRTAQR
jgi:hypothetical protein